MGEGYCVTPFRNINSFYYQDLNQPKLFLPLLNIKTLTYMNNAVKKWTSLISETTKELIIKGRDEIKKFKEESQKNPGVPYYIAQQAEKFLSEFSVEKIEILAEDSEEVIIPIHKLKNISLLLEQGYEVIGFWGGTGQCWIVFLK